MCQKAVRREKTLLKGIKKNSELKIPIILVVRQLLFGAKRI